VRFSTEIPLAAEPGRVWDLLWDVGRVARCLPGAKDIREVIPHQRYEASIDERVGPFTMRFPLQIEVLEADPPLRLKAQASGRDPTLGTALQVTFELTVRKAGKGSKLAIDTEIEIRGPLAGLGQGLVRQKAEGTMTRFADALRGELEGDVPRGSRTP
jgi:carbon monoxide dehydrogenase subunit G